MKKRILAAVLAAATVMSLAGCKEDTNSSGSGNSNTPGNSGATSNGGGDTSEPAAATKPDPVLVDTGYTLAADEDKTLTIAVWNEEWKGFFEKYYKVPDGVTVKWVSNPSDGGVYQTKLDGYLKDGKDDDGNAIDLFLGEADYIKKYSNSTLVADLKALGIDTSQMYDYTVKAGTGDDGVLRAVSYQATPAVVVYRRSIAKDVLGTDDPAEVQSKLDSWDKFDSVAASAKEKGYYMTASGLETYRTFANNNTDKAFLSADNAFQVPSFFDQWLTHAEKYAQNGWSLLTPMWDDEKNAQMGASGKTMCFFGPSWYFNFCMGPAHEQAMGDWAICKGPAEYFWGGTWMLIPESSDSKGLAADVIKAFTVNDDLLNQLVVIDEQYANKKPLMKTYADDASYGNSFLGGQNDIAIMYEVAEGIKWDNSLKTIYDQTFNETLPDSMLKYLQGGVTKDEAWTTFYTALQTVDPGVTLPS